MTSEDRDDYLWDRSGAPDPEVQRLEGLLGPLRYRGKAPLPDATPARTPARRARIAAVAVFAAAAAAVLVWLLARDRDVRPVGGQALAPPVDAAAAPVAVPAVAALRFTSAGGGDGDDGGDDPTMCSGVPGGSGWLAEGGVLETGDAAARIEIADLGHVELAPQSRLRLLTTRDDEHRLALDRGRLHAVVTAPPRIFFIETAAATAVDLGCAYDLEVGPDGSGLLRVTVGYVLLEHGDRSALVPQGARCETRSGIGPGTPYADTASPALRAALQRYDFADEPAALARVLAEATAGDTITLWNLLSRAQPADRAAVFARLAELGGCPATVSSAAIVAGDPAALDTCRAELSPRWQ